VETHFEELDEVLTRQTLGAVCLVEGNAQLLLADAVLLAQTLLLAETDGVVTVSLTLGASVLAGAVGALLHVASGLGRKRNAERARQANLAAILGLGNH